KTESVFVKRYDDPAINRTIMAAWNNYNNGRFEQASLDFDRLSAKGYTHYDILFGAGCANMKYYDFRKSISFFSRCLKERGDHFEALYFRAEIYRQMKDFSSARADLEKLLAIDLSAPLICGLYPNSIADRKHLKKRQSDAIAILKTM
ncbi:MAG: tetratricopeptide repeat protein, partial [Spirochaetota bacterium]